MYLRQLELGHMQNFFYLVGCEETRECAVIDCGYCHEEIMSEAEKDEYRITKIFLTHFHYDHSMDAEVLAEKTGAKIYGYAGGKKDAKDAASNCTIPKEFISLQNGQEIRIGYINGVAMHSPGHQDDHMMYVFEHNLFSGDTLFIGGIGRVDLHGSDPDEMRKTVSFLKTLPDDWMVYPGHNYGDVPFRTLGEEKELNPYLTGELKRW